MPRGLVVLFAFLEALFVVAMGLLAPLLTALVGWASAGAAGGTPVTIWHLAVDAWALGHGVPLSIALGDGSPFLAGSDASFTLSIAPFGIALLTFVLGRRVGRRVAESDDATVVVGSVIAFVAALAALILASAQGSGVAFDVATGTARIVAIVASGVVVGWAPWEQPGGPSFGLSRVAPRWREPLVDAGRVAGGAVLLLVIVASVIGAVAVAASFPAEIELAESLHAGAGGGFVFTMAEIASTPLFLAWIVAWLAGPGFALGLGSLVSPFAATVGALPALPVLGAIPQNGPTLWWVVLVPVLAGGAAATRLAVPRDSLLVTASTGMGAGVVTALGTLIVGSLASGSGGPGRFAQVGIDVGATALALGAEIAAGALVVLVARFLATGPR